MRSRLLQFTVIFLLLQCIQGTLRHFNTKRRHQEDTEYVLKNYRSTFSKTKVDRDITGFPQLRIRKQNAEGEPESNTYYLTNDDHQFARVSYLGEGSKVNILPTLSRCSYIGMGNSKNFMYIYRVIITIINIIMISVLAVTQALNSDGYIQQVIL